MKIKEYNQMMRYLTRPGSDSNFVKPKRTSTSTSTVSAPLTKAYVEKLKGLPKSLKKYEGVFRKPLREPYKDEPADVDTINRALNKFRRPDDQLPTLDKKFPKIMVDPLSPTGFTGMTPEDDKLLAKKDKTFESYLDKKLGVNSLFKKKEASNQQMRELQTKADKYLSVHSEKKPSQVLEVEAKPLPLDIDLFQKNRIEQEKRLEDERKFQELITPRKDPDYYKGLAQILGVTPEKERKYNEAKKFKK